MALSNRTLSGCFEPTLASGLTDFLLVQAAVKANRTPSTAIDAIRRDIRPLKSRVWGRVYDPASSSASSTAVAIDAACGAVPGASTSRAAHGPTGSETRSHINTKPIPSAAQIPSPLSADPAHSFLDHHDRTRRCLPPEFRLRPGPRRLRSQARPRHLLRCGRPVRADSEFPLTAAFCAAWTE